MTANNNITMIHGMRKALIVVLFFGLGFLLVSWSGTPSVKDNKGGNGVSLLLTDKHNNHNVSKASKQIQLENQQALEEMKRTGKKILSHYYVHIPKTAGFSVFTMLMKLIGQGVFPNTPPKQWPYAPCREGTTKLREFDAKFHSTSEGALCNFWMAEEEYHLSTTTDEGDTIPAYHHVYTLVRSPHDHVLSQYFHCTESWEHVMKMKSRNSMPPLEEWLDFHVKSLEHYNATGELLEDSFHCYNPINHQSHKLHFSAATSPDELRERFDVIGTMDQMGKFLCAMTIRYTGIIPATCDCSHIHHPQQGTGVRRRRLEGGARTSRKLGGIWDNVKSKGLWIKSIWNRLSGHVGENEDHGVQHHGATFNVTASQAEKIAKLTQLDNLLYHRAQLAFAQQISDIETDYDITICEKPDI